MPTVSSTDITQWCRVRSAVPSDKDTPFVLNYRVHAESLNVDEQDLKVVLSTVRLLENLQNSRLVQTDATYKVIWQGYPVMLVGTSDLDKIFHPFAVAVCSAEAAEDFRFIFEALHMYDVNWKPDVLLADASAAITAGFRGVFGEPEKRIMCFFHVLKNLEKYLKPLPRNVQRDLKADIRALQLCNDETTFGKASTLFLNKWRTDTAQNVTDCIDYFHSQWLAKDNGWYEGYAPGFPSTNNAIEATNSVIKREHTIRERAPVGQFLNNLLELVTKWSTVRNPQSTNCVLFHTIPSISLPLWTAAYQWAKLNKKVIEGEDHTAGSGQVFYVSSTASGESITRDIVEAHQRTEWKTFSEFQLRRYRVHTIYLDGDDSTCTCAYFVKAVQCKHTLGMKIRLKLTNVPPEAKTVPLGQKRKRGRPALAKKALIVQ